MDELSDLFKMNTYYKQFALHLSIRSLVSKFEKLKILVKQLENMGRPLDYILLCETHLTDTNASLYKTSSYKFLHAPSSGSSFMLKKILHSTFANTFRYLIKVKLNLSS